MKTALAENLFTVSGVLTPNECRGLIERGEAAGFHTATVGSQAGPMMRPGLRDNDRAEFADPNLAAALWDRCPPFVPAELEGGTAVGLDDHFRLYRYDPGQRFKRHQDVVVERSPAVRSRLTCLFYLSGGFAGGQTVFYPTQLVDGIRPADVVVEPRAGDALFFLHEWWHEGRPLEAGRKYVLRSDVFYRFPDGEAAGPDVPPDPRSD